MKKAVTIIDACTNGRVWGKWFRDPVTWVAWFTLFKVVWGLPLSEAELAIFRVNTGRNEPLPGGYFEVWLCLGRRAGKSFALALQGVFAAVFVDWSAYTTPGERAVVMITAATTKQAKAIMGYARALVANVPTLAQMVERSTQDTIELSNGISLEVAVCNFKTIRSTTIVCGICDELAFWDGVDSANPDREVLAALRPAMASIPASRLFCASSPFGRYGALFEAVERHFGKDENPVLVRSGTRTMNPTISEAVVAQAMQEDPLRARREFLAEFTDTDSTFLDLPLIKSAIDIGVSVRPPVPGVEYHMFLDPSSGRGNSFGASICHAEAGPDEGGTVIVQDALLEVVSPFNPSEAISQVRDLARSYSITTPLVTDRYAIGWVSESLNKEGLAHHHSGRDRSTIYLNAAALFTSGRVRLLDHLRLSSQLAGLVRRVSPGGRDRVDHAGAGTMDDLANCTCGALLLAADAAVNRVPIVMPYLATEDLSGRYLGLRGFPIGPISEGDTYIGTSRWFRDQQAKRGEI